MNHHVTNHPQHSLNIQHLSYTYSDQAEPVHVLKDINISFHEGQMYAICGESGSGKTTLLSLLSALDQIQDGDITYDQTSIKTIGYNNFRLKYVNIVFQSFNLIKYMTAAENVQVAIDFAASTLKTTATGSTATGVKRESSALSNSAQSPYFYLEKVGLDRTIADRLISKLSGGQQQRVAIARALASNVPIIVADEPTGNLDEDTEAKIIQIFQDLAHKEHKIVIIVTHSQRVAHHADQVLHLAKGQLS